MAKSRHRSLRTLQRYARPGPRGAVRTTVEFDELGVPAPVEVAPSG